MSHLSISPSSSELEKHLDESLLQKLNSSPESSRAQPGAALLNPNAKAKATPSLLLSPETSTFSGLLSPSSNSPLALLSPPGSRYAFENNDNIPVSPLLSTTNNPLIGNFNNTAIQRPLSAQDFNLNSDTLGSFRPFSAQAVGPSHLFDSTSLSSVGVPERPLSSMEIDMITFKNDVANLVDWIGTLNSNQHRTVIDNLLSNLPDDILNYTRSKLELINYNGYQGPTSRIASPTPLYQSSSQDIDNLDTVLNAGNLLQPHPTVATSAAVNNLQSALSPNFPSFDRSALLQDVGFNRPRSADPYHSKRLRNNLNKGESDVNRTPSKSRSSYRYDDESQQNNSNNNSNNKGNKNDNNRSFDITNLAQQLTQSPLNLNDYQNSNALKLSALSTINSRAQLDSGKRRVLQTSGAQPPLQQQQQQQQHYDDRGRNHVQNTVHNNLGFNFPDDYESRNSSSVPPPQRINYYDSITGSPSLNRVTNKHRTLQPRATTTTNNNNGDGGETLNKIASLNAATKNISLSDNESQTPLKLSNTLHQTPKSPAINPKQITSVKLLNDIPSWLKSLRLHKYTPALQDTPWKELIYLDDKQLEDKGVSAMGARGKLLKAFEVVKQHYEDGLIKE